MSSSADRWRCGWTSACPLPPRSCTSDLDNYLLPLATRLSHAGAGTLACVWGTKQHAGHSTVRLERAAPAAAAPPPGSCYTVRTTAPAQSNAFKEQISEQLSGASPIPPGPVRMQLCFTVGPAGNWLNLWKPAIDATGQILGHEPAAGPWSPLRPSARRHHRHRGHPRITTSHPPP